jgi:flagellin-like hook-associated protein FlgL
MELGNLVRLTYHANVITGAYAKTGRPGAADNDEDEAVSAIQYLINRSIPERPHNESYADEAVSVARTFAEAVAAIAEKLQRMKELAEQATETHSKKKRDKLQQEFEQLAGEINDIVASTEYNQNKLFTADGRNISISIGNGSAVDIAARDLSIDIDGLDLTDDPEAALAAIETKAADGTYYSRYLAEQVSRLESSIGLIEFETDNDLGIEADDDEFDVDLAKEIADYASTRTLEELSVLFEAQANVEPDTAVQLLKDTIEEVSQSEEEESQ